MSNGSTRRTRSDRVAALRLPPSRLRRVLGDLRRSDVLWRVALVLFAALCLWGATEAWRPPLTYRQGDVPKHDILASVAFEVPDEAATNGDKERAQDQARYVFQHFPAMVVNLEGKLFTRVGDVLSAASAENAAWKEFQPAQPDPEMKLASFAEFQQALQGSDPLTSFKNAIHEILGPLRERGMLKDNWLDDVVARGLDESNRVRGNQKEVDIYPNNEPEKRLTAVPLDQLDVQHYKDALDKALRKNPATTAVAGRIYFWLRDRLPYTLELDRDKTQENRQEATKGVDTVMKAFQPRQRLALAGEPITSDTFSLLRDEHKAWLASPQSRPLRVSRSIAMFGLILVVFVFFGLYLYFRQPDLRQNLPHLAAMFVLVIAAVFAAGWLSREEWRPEIIPLVLCGLTLAIAYQRELALLAVATVTGIVVLSIGRSVAEFFILFGTAATAIMLMNSIRSRIKLIQICTAAGMVACLLAIVLGVLDGRTFDARLVGDSVRLGFWTLVAGFLVTGLLPFIERAFGVLTDLSLLELSDVSHPLLQELVRRAPGTYNHSINVGSLAEAATEAIGGRGLLVRVGAYFHDIGKMLKPAYYVENQGHDNRHETLAPAMSTLIIIAHIKDGADLARRHHLPQAIIDFIEQHHGTTLVEYFYRRAEKERQNNPDAVVEEGAFRYPGPKPQTKESAVLMLADAVESASRTLEDPAPARIEGLVEEIVMKRLMDDQFDECPINLQEIRTVQDSLIKSLIAVYHGRVKYPSQKTA